MAIKEHIEKINSNGRKALSIYLTAGFPSKNTFTDTALNIMENGADILELGIPFSDPLADGQIIQHSSQIAISNGVSIKDVLNYCGKIKSKTDKPLVLMGYANPILKYGAQEFCTDALNSGAQGIIIPDVPLEEYHSFYTDDFAGFEKILLTTPTSSNERIKAIDNKSEGFLYCVSVTGTTGSTTKFGEDTLSNLKRTYSSIKNNKMLIGFGIASPDDIRSVKQYCDGVIVGSAVIKKILNSKSEKEIMQFVRGLSAACEN